MHDVVIYEIVCDSNLFLDMGIISDKSRRVLQILPDLAGENIMVPNFGSQFCSPKTVQLVAEAGSSPKNQFSGANLLLVSGRVSSLVNLDIQL